MASAPASYSEVLRNREFCLLLAASLVSVIGDQVARVALSLLVLDRTGSELLSAAVYGASYLPWVLGGPLLATLADRLPPRRVLIGCDLLRAVVVGALVIPGLPVWLLILMIFISELAAPPFESTRSALAPQLLPDDSYVIGVSLIGALHQVAQVVGFAVGGLALAVVSAQQALMVDAVSFVISAALLAGLAVRPASAGHETDSLLSGTAAGLRHVFMSPRLRLLVLMAWLACAVAVVPEGLAAPYALHLGYGSGVVGLLLSTVPLGCAIGGLVVTRLVSPEHRMRLLVPLVALASVPLLPLALDPPLPVVVVLLTASGAGAASLVLVSTTVGREVEPAMRGRVFAVAASGLMVTQGLGVLAGGALAEVLSVHLVLALIGAVGLILTVWVGLAWRRPERSDLHFTSAATAPISQRTE